ncbi:MAG: GTPase HflX, partial [Victivallis vadensis]
HDAAVPYCDYFEGMLSLGNYRVPDSGRHLEQIWTNVPPRVAKFQVGAAYRLPLWELVYHDCVCAHWYWGDYNNKLPSLWDKRDLFNVLYGTMGMYYYLERDWERLTKTCVIDREEVILDIFAERAQTREAVLQVELARAQYSLPRLTRAWTHLSRQHGGGATTRGEGEAQIETDRRLLRRRIQQLREELETVRKQRTTQRKARQRNAVPHGAIVGYTNVGKSSILRALSGAEILVKDQLFATLDPTTRRITLDDNLELLLTDTVGFVRKLPHSLVEAFKSTLEEAVLADFLLLVLDLSSNQLDAEWETTMSVLKELGAEEKNIQVVFNKLDLVDRENDLVRLARMNGLFPTAIYISTATGEGMDKLRERLASLASERFELLRVTLPPARSDLAALAHASGRIYEENYNDQGELELVFTIGPVHRHKFEEFRR